MTAIQQVAFRLTGTRPLVMHNCQPFLDPFNAMGREKNQIARKSAARKTDADHERLSYLEFMMSLYLDDNNGIIIPAENIERMIRDGATENRNGKAVQAAVTVIEAARLCGPDGKQYGNPEAMWAADDGKRHRFLAAVKQGQARILRSRPIFHRWSCEFTASFIPSVVSRETIVRAVEYAGVVKGLGDYRPRYGSFSAEVL